MVKVHYDERGNRHKVVEVLHDALDRRDPNEEIHLVNVHTRVYGYNSHRHTVEDKVVDEYKVAQLQRDIRDVRKMRPVVDAKHVNYDIVKPGDESFIQISCSIDGDNYTWIPREIKLPREIKDALGQ